MKSVTRRTGNRRLNKLADFLEKVPRDRFDLDIIARTNANGELPSPKTCGTAGCAVGFTPCAFPKYARYKKYSFTQNLCVVSVDSPEMDFDFAEVFFNLTRTEVNFLFHPEHYPVNRRGKVSVANRIRRFTKKRPSVEEMEKEYG